jgi:rubrerythrin
LSQDNELNPDTGYDIFNRKKTVTEGDNDIQPQRGKPMTQDATLDILKQALLLEKRGNAFYRKVAQNTTNSAVECFFNIMADEEAKHIQVITDQMRAYKSDGQLLATVFEDGEKSDAPSQILDPDQKSQIAAADFEAAAISAAISMEEKAIQLYADRAEAATDKTEKALYNWLSGWEREHLNFLIDMDKELTEKIWYDQQFWPF